MFYTIISNLLVVFSVILLTKIQTVVKTVGPTCGSGNKIV